jgi:hypothetical protein
MKGLFRHSPISEKIWKFGEVRFGEVVTPLLHVRVLTIYGAGAKRPSNAAGFQDRSRKFKTRLTEEAMRFFYPEDYIYVQGEMTIHGLYRKYGEDIGGKCIIFDDGAVMCNAMMGRSRARLFDALSDLLANRVFTYDAARVPFNLKGNISCIFNIPTPTWKDNRTLIKDSTTFGNKLLMLHSDIDYDYHREISHNYRTTMDVRVPFKFEEKNRYVIENEEEFREDNQELFREAGIKALQKPDEMEDLFFAIARENARINDRNCICRDDLNLLRILCSYLIDWTLKADWKVVWLLDKESYSYDSIIEIMREQFGINITRSSISKIKAKAIERGVLDTESKLNPKEWRKFVT